MRLAEAEIEFYYKKMQELMSEYAEKDDEGQYKVSADGQFISIIPGKE
jgi:hypothetical protein